MLFNSPTFVIFFCLLYVAFRLIPVRMRPGLLLVASFVFYTLWHPAYFLLLAATLCLNYLFLWGVATSARPRVYVSLSVFSTIGLLAYFKYSSMAVDTVGPLVELISGWRPPVPELFLPLGISFYSFQILALVIDEYRARGGRDPAGRGKIPSFGRYLLFISFFPQLIAGPILRGGDFLPQLERGGQLTRERNRRGLWLIASGLGKKVICADFLLAPFVNAAFDVPALGSAPLHLVAIYSFAFQIYFDFSGYVDIARGLACLLGFEIPLNFTEPYLSRNPAEFWRRWHITLSRWLRDYLYIALGGNRAGSTRTYVNLLLTMLLGGLWHGAAWNFVVWGGLHGLLLVGHRRFRGSNIDENAPLKRRDVPQVLLLFHAVCFAWIFFRASTFAGAMEFIGGLFQGGYSSEWPIIQVVVVLVCAILHPLERIIRLRLEGIHAVTATRWWGPLAEGAALGLILGLAFAVSGAGGEFIYFQF